MTDLYVAALPKAELHVHIEGTFEPELIFQIADRNRIKLPYPDIETLRRSYQFKNLQSFLNLYYSAMSVLKTEQDFCDLANAYFAKAKRDRVVHAEIFFDPQAHMHRNVPLRVVMDGLWAAVVNSKKNYGITSKLIMCFLRDMTAESAMQTFDAMMEYGDRIIGVGLDSAEVGNPPSKFKDVFAKAKAAGFQTVAHAGEEGPPEYVWEAIQILKVSRIDHGVRSLEDPKLVEHLRDHAIPLTVCPMSNVRLKVFNSMEEHSLKKMLRLGLRATINSDDPAYFGGYIGDNYLAVQEGLNLSLEELKILSENSINASFLSPTEKQRYLAMFG